jgi:hypothetical protein
LVIGLKRGRGQFLDFLGVPMILNAESVFLVVNASLQWLNKARRVNIAQFSLLFISRHSLQDFFRNRPLLPIGWRIVQILRQHQRKTTNTVPNILGAIQAARQSTSYQITIILHL